MLRDAVSDLHGVADVEIVKKVNISCLEDVFLTFCIHLEKLVKVLDVATLKETGSRVNDTVSVTTSLFVAWAEEDL